MKIGIIGYGFVGRATYIFSKNYYSKDKDNDEIFEVLPDTVTTPATSNSVRTYSADGNPATPASLHPRTNVVSSNGGGTHSTPPPPFFKRIFFKQVEVFIYDINPNLCQPKGITLEEVDRNSDLLFFCLPTPLNHDGTCYTKILEDTISQCSNPYKIIRSTIPVGFAAKHGCYFMPEFLTEATWENDFRSTKEWIVGMPRDLSICYQEEFKKRISQLIKRSHKNGSIDSRTIVFCDTNEAEMLKLMKNCFLSAKVGIMNEFFDFAQATNTDFNHVITLAKLDARMGTSHFQVPGPDGMRGFGGTCFPKDTHSLYCQMTAHGVCPHIYPAVLTRNDSYDRTEREWSHDTWRTTIPLPNPKSKVVVVFSNGKEESKYFDDIIQENLSKHNVVIQVIRKYDNSSKHIQSTAAKQNHIIKYWPEPSTPIFFPRVDECYYSPYHDTSSYETTRDIMHIIDLWNSHEEMILYVIKHAKEAIHNRDTAISIDSVIEDNESGTEGFDDNSLDDYDVHYPCSTIIKNTFDYAKVIEDYYQDNFGGTHRKLVVMF